MTTKQIIDMSPAYRLPCSKARSLAEKQGRPAYVVLGPLQQIYPDFPGVWCHRVHADGRVDCSVICA